MICNSCGYDNRDDWAFCSNCGSRLESIMNAGMADSNTMSDSYDEGYEESAESGNADPYSIDAIECPNCAANVKIDLSQDFAYCEYCGSCLSLVELRKEILEEEARIKEAEARIAEANALEAQANAEAAQAYSGEGYYEEPRPSIARDIAMGVAAAALNFRPRVMSTPYSRMGRSEPAYDYYPDYVEEPIPVPVQPRTTSAPVTANSVSDAQRVAVKTEHKAPVEVHKPQPAAKAVSSKDYSSVMPSKTPVAVHAPVKKDVSSIGTTSGLKKAEPEKERRGLFGWGKPKPAAPAAPTKPATSVSKPSPVSRPTVSKPVVSKPVASKPSSGGLFSKPSPSSSVSRPSVSKPSVSRPSISKPSVSRPTVSKPSVSRPSVSRPSVSRSVSKPVSRPSSSRSSGSKSFGGGKKR